MPNPTLPEQIGERLDRLLSHYEELQNSNERLMRQVRQLSEEGSVLRQRLAEAAERVDALIAAVPALVQAATAASSAFDAVVLPPLPPLPPTAPAALPPAAPTDETSA